MRRRHWMAAWAATVVFLGAALAGESTPPASLFPNLRIDKDSKTIEMDGVFCLGEYPLELLVCQNAMKDYESLISSPCRPSFLHAALNLLGLKERVRDAEDPAKVLQEGDPIDILIRFTKDGKTVTVEPRDLVLDLRSKRRIEGTPWVFYGSIFFKDPAAKDREIYLADAESWLIGILGDTASVIDLPRDAAGKYGALEIDRQAAPPKGTKATVIIRPAANRRPAPPAKAE